MYGIVYKITNLINLKTYTGQTTRSLKERWDEHKWGSKKKSFFHYPLYRAFKKYGFDNFKIEPVCTAESKEELDKLEIYYSEIFNSLSPNGYTLRAGNSGGKHSEETKIKISKANKGKPAKNKGIPRTEEEKIKISNSNKGKQFSDEHRLNLSIAAKNRTFTPEHRAKIGKIKWRPILCLTNGTTYQSITEASNKLGLNKANITSVCKGRYKQTGGLIFKYL